MLNVPPSLQNEGLQALLAQFFGRPAARNSRTDDNGIVGMRLLSRAQNGRADFGCCHNHTFCSLILIATRWGTLALLAGHYYAVIRQMKPVARSKNAR